MRITFRPGVAMLAALILTGCGYQKTWMATDTTQLTAKPGGYDLPVYKGPAERPHKILGELSVSTRIKANWSLTSSHDLAIEELRKEAIKKGADAVVLMKTQEADDGGKTRLTVSGTLVIYTAPPPTSASRG